RRGDEEEEARTKHPAEARRHRSYSMTRVASACVFVICALSVSSVASGQEPSDPMSAMTAVGGGSADSPALGRDVLVATFVARGAGNMRAGLGPASTKGVR